MSYNRMQNYDYPNRSNLDDDPFSYRQSTLSSFQQRPQQYGQPMDSRRSAPYASAYGGDRYQQNYQKQPQPWQDSQNSAYRRSLSLEEEYKQFEEMRRLATSNKQQSTNPAQKQVGIQQMDPSVRQTPMQNSSQQLKDFDELRRMPNLNQPNQQQATNLNPIQRTPQLNQATNSNQRQLQSSNLNPIQRTPQINQLQATNSNSIQRSPQLNQTFSKQNTTNQNPNTSLIENKELMDFIQASRKASDSNKEVENTRLERFSQPSEQRKSPVVNFELSSTTTIVIADDSDEEVQEQEEQEQEPESVTDLVKAETDEDIDKLVKANIITKVDLNKDSFHCILCDFQCNSKNSLNSHIQCAKHKKICKEIENGKSSMKNGLDIIDKERMRIQIEDDFDFEKAKLLIDKMMDALINYKLKTLPTDYVDKFMNMIRQQP